MKRILVASLAMLVLGACSTMNSSYNPDDDLDLNYVGFVEHWARQLGTRVVWVNVPRKQPAATQ